MSARISLVNLLLMLLGALACAVGMVFLINFLLAGPRLGPHYDFLQGYKQSSVSREILIIDTEDVIEGSDIFTVLMTLTEMQAAELVLTGAVSPSSSPITVTEAEIRGRFADEYSLLGSNIRNLFEGIRMGFVSPLQAPIMVEQVVDLAEQGRDRLIAALMDRDEDFLRSVVVFGNYIEADTKARLDWDGKLRRIKPVDEDIMHPVYQRLVNRYAISQIETQGGMGEFLWLRSHEGRDLDIPLDNDGNIITVWNLDFRRINIELFREYEEKDSALHKALEDANELRAFSLTAPDRIPLFLADNARLLLEELLRTPDSDNRFEWIAARNNYFFSLRDFIDSSSQTDLVREFDEQIAALGSSEEDQLITLSGRRDELIRAFESIREIYAELSVIHAELKDQLALSFCIMGPWPNAQSSALLANVLITGSHVKPVHYQYIPFWSVTGSLIVLLIIFLMRPSALLITGFILSVLAALVFGALFIFYSYWIDPLIVLGSSLTGTLVLFLGKCAYLNYRARTFRMAYRNSVSKDSLRNLIQIGRPRLTENNISFTAVVAIKDNTLLGKENHERTQNSSKAKRSFYTIAKKEIFNAGGVIAGFEGDTILACFGSPLVKSGNPVGDACAFVSLLMNSDKTSWRFGIDAGECSFSWIPETGYSVSGRPVVRARILVSRTARYKIRAIITDCVRETISLPGKKIGTLYDLKDAIFALNS